MSNMRYLVMYKKSLIVAFVAMITAVVMTTAVELHKISGLITWHCITITYTKHGMDQLL